MRKSVIKSQTFVESGLKPVIKLARDGLHTGEAVYVVHDHGGEFKQLYRLNLESGKFAPLSANIPWAVSSFTLTSSDGLTNADGHYYFNGTDIFFQPCDLVKAALMTTGLIA